MVGETVTSGGQRSENMSWKNPIIQDNIRGRQAASVIEAVAVLGAVVGAAQQVQRQTLQHPSQTLGGRETVDHFYHDGNIEPFGGTMAVQLSSPDPGLESERQAFLKRSEEYAKSLELRQEKRKEKFQGENLRNNLPEPVPLNRLSHGKGVVKGTELRSIADLRSVVERRENEQKKKAEEVRRLAEKERALQMKREMAKEALRVKEAEEQEGLRQRLLEEQRAAEEFRKQSEEKQQEQELLWRRQEEDRQRMATERQAAEVMFLKQKEQEEMWRRQEAESKAAQEKLEESARLQKEVEERLRKEREEEIKRAEVQRLREIEVKRKLEEDMRRQETAARLEKERRQEEAWRQEQAWRQQEAERRAAEQEEANRIRRAVEVQERQQRAREQHLRAEEERRLQEMAVRQLEQKSMELAALEQRREREALEMAERQRRLAAEEEQRLGYQHMMEERRMLLQRRHQLDILERQEQERLCFTMQGPEMERGVFPRQEHERGHQFRQPFPPRQQSSTAGNFVGHLQDNDNIVNPLYTNHQPIRGRGAPRARGTGIPPPQMPPPNYCGPVGYNRRRGSGFHGLPCPVPPPKHCVQNRAAGRGGFEGRGRSHLAPPRSEPPPPGEEFYATGNGGGGDGRRRGDCLPPTTAGDITTQKNLRPPAPPPPVIMKTPTSLKEHFENLQVHL